MVVGQIADALRSELLSHVLLNNEFPSRVELLLKVALNLRERSDDFMIKDWSVSAIN